jgi:hypothetical protein
MKETSGTVEELTKALLEAESTRDKCLHGSSTPNGIKDLPDIFWLVGWSDLEKRSDAD